MKRILKAGEFLQAFFMAVMAAVGVKQKVAT